MAEKGRSTAAKPDARDFMLSANAARFAEDLQTDRESVLGKFSDCRFVAYDLVKARVVDGADQRAALIQTLKNEHGDEAIARFLVQRVGK